MLIRQLVRAVLACFLLYADDKGAGGGGGGDQGGDPGAGGNQGGNADGKGGAEGDGKGDGDGKGGAGGKDGDWDPNWRQKIAGDDAKQLKQLERYASPKDVWSKARSFEVRLSSGELRSALPKDATPEQVTAWRQENGIPTKPEEYQLTLAEGREIAAEDKPIIDAFLTTLHGQNATNAQASAAIDWYYATQARMTEERTAKDQEIAQKTSDALHTEWGTEYRKNMNMVEGLLATMPKEVVDPFKHGRMADGTPLLANAGVLKALVSWAREINPVTTLVGIPAGEGASMALDGEIAAIEKDMKAPKGTKEYKAYWDDDKRQARYRDLLGAREKAKAK